MTPRLLLPVAAALVALSLSACAPASDEPISPYLTAAPGANGPGTAPAGDGVYPIVPATHPHVQLTCPLIGAVHYDPDAIPVDDVTGVFVCTTAPYTDAPDGTPQIEEFVDRVATEDIPGLLEAYAEPDAERPDDVMCTMQLMDPLIVWIHWADERITPVYAPTDECGFPTPAASAVYQGLDLHRLLVAREKLES